MFFQRSNKVKIKYFYAVFSIYNRLSSIFSIFWVFSFLNNLSLCSWDFDLWLSSKMSPAPITWEPKVSAGYRKEKCTLSTIFPPLKYCQWYFWPLIIIYTKKKPPITEDFFWFFNLAAAIVVTTTVTATTWVCTAAWVTVATEEATFTTTAHW